MSTASGIVSTAGEMDAKPGLGVDRKSVQMLVKAPRWKSYSACDRSVKMTFLVHSRLKGRDFFLGGQVGVARGFSDTRAS